MIIHPISAFKKLPTAKKVAVVANVAGVTALNIAAAAHGKKVLNPAEGEKLGIFKKLGAGYGDWWTKVSSKVSEKISGLFHKGEAAVEQAVEEGATAVEKAATVAEEGTPAVEKAATAVEEVVQKYRNLSN